MTRRGITLGLLAILVAPAVPVLTGCGNPPEAPEAPTSGPLLVVGIDGLEWNVALPLIAEGSMPNLRALMERGTYGKLETHAPAKSPVIWTTIATGKTPEQHGILDFTRTTEAGKRVLYDSADRRTKALWNILTDAGQQATVIGWWNTFPAEEILGVVVSQANTLEHIARRRLLKPGGMLRGVSGQVHPAQRQDEMLDVVAEVDAELPALLDRVFGSIARAEDRRADRDNLEACAWSLRADESNRRLALRLARETPPPAWFAVYFGTPDVVGHRFWRYHQPEAFEHPPTDAETQRFGDVVRDAYRHADTVLGELVDAFPEETTVFVLSDHGMHAHHVETDFDVSANGRLERESGGHEDGPEGLIVVAGPGIRNDARLKPLERLTRSDLPTLGTAIDVAPTMLALRGVAVGRDMEGQVLLDLFTPDRAASLDVHFVQTHDSIDWIESRRTTEHDAPWTEQRIEQLRTLGYIE